jgi:DNA-binding HxlR family transcriptional regulator
MNHSNRAHAGSSRALDDHSGAVATSVILALANNCRRSFSDLLREIGNTSQSVLASTLVELCSQGFLIRNNYNGAYGLTSRAQDMIDRSKAASQKRGRQEARRRAA